MKPTRLIEGKWTVIHKLDIKPIIDSKIRLREQLARLYITHVVPSDVKHIYDRLNIILDHLDEICNHLDIQSRTKRGLINGLGSIVKAITGNLDNDDLVNIQKDLETLKVAYNQQISVTNDSLEDYNKQIAKIVNIQNALDEKFMEINNSRSQLKLALTFLYQAQTLQELSERLTTAITFAEHGMYHYNIIQSHILQDTLNSISKNVMISNNINDIEPFIKVHCKILDKIVYFILEIPLVKPQVYKTKRIVPIIQNFPTCTYPIMRKVTLAYTEYEVYQVEDCLELSELICKGSILQKNGCDTEILRNKTTTSCSIVPVKCPVEEIQEVAPQAIYMYLNKTTEVKIKCRNAEETTWIKGSYLLDEKDCEVSFSGIKRFQTRESSERIIVSKLNIDTKENVPEMELTYDAEKISSRLKQLKQIQRLQTQDNHNNVQYGLIAFIILIIMVLIGYNCLRRKIRKESWTSKSGGDSQLTCEPIEHIKISSNEPEVPDHISECSRPIPHKEHENGAISKLRLQESAIGHIVIAPWTTRLERQGGNSPLHRVYKYQPALENIDSS